MYRFTSDPQSEEDAQNPETPPERLRELAWSDPALLLLVAQNVAVTKNLLEEFLQRDLLFFFREFRVDPSFVEELQKSIAKNPNTPAELLNVLFERFPKEVQENPSYGLLILESASLLENRRRQELLEALCHPEASLFLLQQASTSYSAEVRLYVARHPKATESILRRLSDDHAELVREAVAEHPNTPVESLQKLSSDSNDDVRDSVATHGRIPYQTLASLAEKNDAYLRLLALHPETPEDRLEELAEDNALLPFVLHNPNAPSDLLQACAEIPELQDLVAKNPNTPLEALQILPTSTQITRAILQNPSLPSDWVGALLTDASPKIRSLARFHPNVPGGLLALLLQAGASIDLMQITTTPEEIDPQDLVRLCNQGFFGKLLVASHPKTPEPLLRVLSQNASVELRLAVANNVRLPSSLEEALANDANTKVRAVIAKRSHKEALLYRLADDFFAEVRVSIAQRLEAPALLRLTLANDRSLEVRSALVANPEISSEVLQKLSLDTEPIIRRMVVDHANTSRQTLYVLARDPQSHISKAAQEKLSPVYIPRPRRSSYVPAPRQKPLEVPTEDLWQIAREVLQKRIARYQKKKR
jgi:hypothetical protein